MRYVVKSMKKMIILIMFVMIGNIECSRTIEISDENGMYTMKVKVGSGGGGGGGDGVEVKIVAYIGDGNDSYMGEWILDEQMRYTEYANMLQGQQHFYNYQTSSTAHQFNYYQSPQRYGDFYAGINVEDVFDINGFKIRRLFTAVNQIPQMYNNFYNGQTIFKKGKESIIDQLYQQGQIRSNEYILVGNAQIVEYDIYFSYSITQYNINLIYDLDATDELYTSYSSAVYPSNLMTLNPNVNLIMAYGIYLNGVDITDKLKYKQINIDATYSSYGGQFVYIPKDIYSLIYPLIEVFGYEIKSCKNCLCESVTSLPYIKLITQEYVIYITPDQYFNYREDTDSCIPTLQYSPSDSYNLLSSLLFQNNVSIHYNKNNNSVKLYGLDTIKHMTIRNLIIIMSVLNSIVFSMLVALAISFVLSFKSTKLEQIQFTKRILKKKI